MLKPEVYVDAVVLQQLGIMLMSVARVITESHADVHGLGCSWGLYGYPWHALPPETMLRSVACADTGGQVDVCGLCSS